MENKLLHSYFWRLFLPTKGLLFEKWRWPISRPFKTSYNFPCCFNSSHNCASFCSKQGHSQCLLVYPLRLTVPCPLPPVPSPPGQKEAWEGGSYACFPPPRILCFPSCLSQFSGSQLSSVIFEPTPSLVKRLILSVSLSTWLSTSRIYSLITVIPVSQRSSTAAGYKYSWLLTPTVLSGSRNSWTWALSIASRPPSPRFVFTSKTVRLPRRLPLGEEAGELSSFVFSSPLAGARRMFSPPVLLLLVVVISPLAAQNYYFPQYPPPAGTTPFVLPQDDTCVVRKEWSHDREFLKDIFGQMWRFFQRNVCT